MTGISSLSMDVSDLGVMVCPLGRVMVLGGGSVVAVVVVVVDMVIVLSISAEDKGGK